MSINFTFKHIASTVIERSKEYLGLNETIPSTLGSSLREIVSYHGPAALYDSTLLEEQLRKAGVSEIDIYRACLVSKTPGVRGLADDSKATKQSDLDKFVHHVVAETGLSRSSAIQITTDFATAAGIAIRRGKDTLSQQNQLLKKAYVLPWDEYEDNLKKVQAAFEAWEESGDEIPEEDLNRLSTLSSVGIPQAQYYYGSYMLHTLNPETGEECESRPISILKEAAEAGERKAAAALGDYYYKKGGSQDWSIAFSYYTGYGSLALNRFRQSAVSDIVNHRKLNKILLSLSAVLLFLILLSVIFAPGIPLYPRLLLLGIICVLLCSGTLCVGMFHFRSNPYDNVYYVPMAMFVIWAIYTTIRFLC